MRGVNYDILFLAQSRNYMQIKSVLKTVQNKQQLVKAKGENCRDVILGTILDYYHNHQ